MKPPRIRLSIGEIVTDQPGLSHHELVEALEQTLIKQIAHHGIGIVGPSVSRASASAKVENGDSTLSQRVATATIKAVQQ